MKGILIVLDGIGDRPCKELNGKTPLEAAETPNLDWFAMHGVLGQHVFKNKKSIPESDEAVLELLGNKIPLKARGYFEAVGAGIKLQRGDLAMRTNFSTITNVDDARIIDRRVGRKLTAKEARILAKYLNSKIKLPVKFLFKSTVQHRGVLVLRGCFSDNITDPDPAYHTPANSKEPVFKMSQPLDDDENTAYSADIVNNFILQSYNLLKDHPINLKRKKRGMLMANIVLPRDACSEQPELKKFDKNKWASVMYMPVERGIVKLSGMKNYSFSYPELRDFDVYKLLDSALIKACRFSIRILKKKQKKFDYFYVHLKETDLPGHDCNPLEKKKMIEEIDQLFFRQLKKIFEKSKKNRFKIIVTGDHNTPCGIKTHSSDPVPVLFFDFDKKNKAERKRFTENNCQKGRLGQMAGNFLLKKFGFAK